MTSIPITIARGDGIGPEIMDAVLSILKEAKARIEPQEVIIGESVYQQGFTSGISKEAWKIVKQNKILLKAPITTPQGKGYKSLNVTFRKALGLFANIRPVVSYYPFVPTNHKNMDIVIVRENEEDLYAGIEYRSTPNSFLSFKLISREGCEKIIRYAFEYAKASGRKKVTCMSKDNIMKLADGNFHNIFDSVAAEYPGIVKDHYIIDIGAARIASKPQNFDVIVTLNLYGDIISDIASEVSGSVGMANSANIGTKYAMFEAVHGSAPDIAGKNIANPSGLLNAAASMLEYIGQGDIAARIQNAWLKTIESGIHTVDIYNTQNSTQKVSTKEFTQAVINNLGQKPAQLASIPDKEPKKISVTISAAKPVTQKLVGVDIYLAEQTMVIEDIVKHLQNVSQNLRLSTISQKGLIVWPETEVEEITHSMLRLRYLKQAERQAVTSTDIVELQHHLIQQGFSIAITNTLFEYDGAAGFTKAQGE